MSIQTNVAELRKAIVELRDVVAEAEQLPWQAVKDGQGTAGANKALAQRNAFVHRAAIQFLMRTGALPALKI